MASVLVNYLLPRRLAAKLAVRTSRSGRMPTLPAELWMAIAEFIGTVELENLIGVNRIFFEIVMDNRYREMELIDADPISLFRKIDRLQYVIFLVVRTIIDYLCISRSDSLISRVQILKIWPNVVWNAIQAQLPPLEQQYQLTAEREGTNAPNLELRRTRTSVTPTTSPSPLLSLAAIPRSAESKSALVVETMKRLTSIRQLHLHWPRHCEQTNHPVWTLFTDVWPVTGPLLRSLILDMPVAILADFVTSIASIAKSTSLRELKIAVSGDYRTKDLKEGIISLLPFIHDHSSSLESLSITIHGHAETSPLFRGLGRLPRLTALSLTIPFDNEHVLDPSSFHQVLVDHPNLQSLTIQNRRCGGMWQHRTAPVTTDTWARQCFEGICLAQLKKLELGMKYHTGVPRHMMTAIKPLCFPLSSLTITEPCLKWEDLTTVLKYLQPRHIKSLSLFIEILNEQVLELFVESCPNLQHLTLSVQKVGTRFEDFGSNSVQEEEVS